MTTATEYEIETDDIPLVEEVANGSQPFDPRYPDSTPDAPYGFKPNGEPYKRHHNGNGKSKGNPQGRMPASDRQAETAAALLAKLNILLGFGLKAAGMPESAATLASNNAMFESMAKEALLADPALCRKILSAGKTSGTTGLIMAYAMLGASTYPAMRDEYRSTHPKEVE